MFRKTIWETEQEEKRVAYEEYKFWQKVAADARGVEPEGFYITGKDVEQAKNFQQVKFGENIFDAHVVKVPYRSNSAWELGSKATHYQIFVWVNGDRSRGKVFEYSQGSAIKTWPRFKDVLYSLINDATAATGTFKDFCGEFGYDFDSRKAESIYNACRDTLDWFANNRISTRILFAWTQEYDQEDMGEPESEPEQGENSDENIPF